MKSIKKVAATVAIASLSVVGATQVLGQVKQDQPIKGTIPVKEGADYQALAGVTAEQARNAALARSPGATFVESELDEEDGYLVYEVELKDGLDEIDVLVDAGNWTVLHSERERDDD